MSLATKHYQQQDNINNKNKFDSKNTIHHKEDIKIKSNANKNNSINNRNYVNNKIEVEIKSNFDRKMSQCHLQG